MDEDWAERTVVVTGAARGQGATEAARFAAAGATVVLADVDGEGAASTAASIGKRARGVRLDVSSHADWAEPVDGLSDLPPVRVLVNNAGIHWNRPLMEEPAEELERMLRVNVVGAQIGIRHLAGVMRDARGGSIVNICSVLAEGFEHQLVLRHLDVGAARTHQGDFSVDGGMLAGSGSR
jgi:3alpha(or 20beta)-hydroxysteroid dehydrogenase